VDSALLRKESRGLHYTLDYPQTDEAHFRRGYRCCRVAKYLEWILLQMTIASQGRIPRREKKPLPGVEFSHKKATLMRKVSRRRFSAPWDGGVANGPIAYEECGRFRQLRPQTIARTSLANKSKPQVFVPDGFPDQHGHPLPLENQHRDDGVLGRRAGRWEQSGPELQELLGRELDLRITAASILPSRPRAGITFQLHLPPGRIPFIAPSLHMTVTYGSSSRKRRC